uniref:Mediator of RNA polymerase II transcription subunit 15 n=1 Tax=Neogobius melanostomus TaxID=47308 RepID=A0A8C6TWX5_9GOBI
MFSKAAQDLFLNKLVSSANRIEDAMRKAGTAHSKSSTDMETHVYVKAKSREEYLSLVARLIIHFRDFREFTLTLRIEGETLQLKTLHLCPVSS